MINDRDSKTNFSSYFSVEFPYGIGTIMEMNSSPDVLAEIRQYRVTGENIFVGLSSKVHDINPDPEVEITIDELMANWKRTKRIILTTNIGTRIQLGEDFDHYARQLSIFK